MVDGEVSRSSAPGRRRPPRDLVLSAAPPAATGGGFFACARPWQQHRSFKPPSAPLSAGSAACPEGVTAGARGGSAAAVKPDEVAHGAANFYP